jgi:hypothetical protein
MLDMENIHPTAPLTTTMHWHDTQLCWGIPGSVFTHEQGRLDIEKVAGPQMRSLLHVKY